MLHGGEKIKGCGGKVFIGLLWNKYHLCDGEVCVCIGRHWRRKVEGITMGKKVYKLNV